MTVAALLCSWLALPASAQRLRSSEELDELNGVDVVEKLGGLIPLETEFVTAEGETQPLSRYINGARPAIVVMVLSLDGCIRHERLPMFHRPHDGQSHTGFGMCLMAVGA